MALNTAPTGRSRRVNETLRTESLRIRHANRNRSGHFAIPGRSGFTLIYPTERDENNFPVSLTISGCHWSYPTSVLRRGSSKALVGYDKWHPDLGLFSKSGGYFRPIPTFEID